MCLVRDRIWLLVRVRPTPACPFSPSSDVFLRHEPLSFSRSSQTPLWAYPAPGRTWSSASLTCPGGFRFLPEGRPPKKQTCGAWEPGPARGSARCVLSRSGDQTQRRFIMYRNSVSLIGFTGKDAEARTTNNQKPFTVLSLATQSSYKDKRTGEYTNRTEWHRVIAWGKLGEFAQKIPKGASGRRWRDCQPRIRRQETPGHKAPDRRNSRHVHPQTRPRRESSRGRAGGRRSRTRGRGRVGFFFAARGSPASPGFHGHSFGYISPPWTACAGTFQAYPSDDCILRHLGCYEFFRLVLRKSGQASP